MVPCHPTTAATATRDMLPITVRFPPPHYHNNTRRTNDSDSSRDRVGYTYSLPTPPTPILALPLLPLPQIGVKRPVPSTFREHPPTRSRRLTGSPNPALLASGLKKRGGCPNPSPLGRSTRAYTQTSIAFPSTSQSIEETRERLRSESIANGEHLPRDDVALSVRVLQERLRLRPTNVPDPP